MQSQQNIVSSPACGYNWKTNSGRAQSQGAKLVDDLQNCSGVSRVSSSQYHTCSALHRRSQVVRQRLQNKLHSPIEWASWMPPTPKKRSRSMCAGFAAHGRRAVQQRVPLDRASVTRCSAAWSMAPAGYILLPLQNKKDVPERQGNRTAKTNKRTNEFRDKPTSNRKQREGGSHGGGCVCDVGTDGPLQSLVTSVS